MPWLQTIYDRYKPFDLNIVGLTTVNRTSTDASVRRFIDDHDITYPILKENGSARSYYNMRGTPFMAFVRDGMLVWEHRLTTEQFPEEIVARFVQATP